MAVALRLMRMGKKHKPYYRIIAIDKRKKRDTRYIENVGSYNPLIDGGNITLDRPRFDYWNSKGAQISEGLSRLLKNKKLMKAA